MLDHQNLEEQLNREKLIHKLQTDLEALLQVILEYGTNFLRQTSHKASCFPSISLAQLSPELLDPNLLKLESTLLCIKHHR